MRIGVTWATMKGELEQLLRKVRSCEICLSSLPHGVRPVLQCDERARILIAGQAPGRRVHESGVPFDDPSGDRLRDWMGLSKKTFYDASRVAILPMGFCYPGTGKSGDLPPRAECAPEWRERLLAQLPNIELTLVLGKYAMDAHLSSPKRTVTEAVQSWTQEWPTIVPLPHPSPRNQVWFKRNSWFLEELIPKLQRRISQILPRP